MRPGGGDVRRVRSSAVDPTTKEDMHSDDSGDGKEIVLCNNMHKRTVTLIIYAQYEEKT